MFSTIIAAIITIVIVTVILVALLLYVKIKLTPEGTVKIDINAGKKTLDVPQGGDLRVVTLWGEKQNSEILVSPQNCEICKLPFFVF